MSGTPKKWTPASRPHSVAGRTLGAPQYDHVGGMAQAAPPTQGPQYLPGDLNTTPGTPKKQTLVSGPHLITSRTLHDNSGAHGEGGYGQNGADHPLGAGKFGIHAQNKTFLIRDALEDLVHPLGTEQDLLFLRILVDVLPLGIELQTRATDAGLVSPATSVALDRRDRGLMGSQGH